MKRFTSVMTILILLGAISPAFGEKITIANRGDDNARYAEGLIRLALSKVENDYEINVINQGMTFMRQKENLLEGTMHIMWTATSKDTESELLPVRVPIYKGLLGRRVLIVHQDNERAFEHIRSFDQLKRFKYCQGRFWPDTDILEHNGLTVVPATKYEGMFDMVDGGRCDAFPRGINEPWVEVKRRSDLDLAVEGSLIMEYKMPFYLFTSPSNKKLNETLYKGLMIAIKDGSFDEYFNSDPMIQSVLDMANVEGRKIFKLENPMLPADTPVDDPSLWL